MMITLDYSRVLQRFRIVMGTEVIIVTDEQYNSVGHRVRGALIDLLSHMDSVSDERSQCRRCGRSANHFYHLQAIIWGLMESSSTIKHIVESSVLA